MTPSLSGLRVLDLTRLLPGPIATLRLAELGADVLKIEAPGDGDYARTMLQSDADRASGMPSAFYRIVNRGKRQLTLDLKSEKGRAKLIELARDADVLVESFRPSVIDDPRDPRAQRDGEWSRRLRLPWHWPRRRAAKSALPRRSIQRSGNRFPKAAATAPTRGIRANGKRALAALIWRVSKRGPLDPSGHFACVRYVARLTVP